MPIVMTQTTGTPEQWAHGARGVHMIMAVRVCAASTRTQHLCSTCRVPAVVALVSVLSSRPLCAGRLTPGSPAVSLRCTPQHAYGQHVVCTQRLLRCRRCSTLALDGVGAGTLPQCWDLDTPWVPVYAAACTAGKASHRAGALVTAGLQVRLRPGLINAAC